jgi:hypothetical protein
VIVLICGVPVVVTGMTAFACLVVKATNNNWFGAIDRLTSHNAGKHIDHPEYLPGYELSGYENTMRAMLRHDQILDRLAALEHKSQDGPDD